MAAACSDVTGITSDALMGVVDPVRVGQWLMKLVAHLDPAAIGGVFVQCIHLMTVFHAVGMLVGLLRRRLR